MKRGVFILAILTLTLTAWGQRNYASSSVLSTGKWVKVSTNGKGVYKVTATFLQKAGYSIPVNSNSIRFYGNGGMVLPESNNEKITDDLIEQQIDVVDGGDGQFDEGDYFLFYAPGASGWKYNDSSKHFEFSKNPYTDLSYYFIQIAGQSNKRLAEKSNSGTPTLEVDRYLELIRFEKDSSNFLNSGREWYGESFGNGFPASRLFPIANEGVIQGSIVELSSEVVGRSFVNPNKLAVSLNGRLVFQHTTPPSIGTLLEPIANVSRLSITTTVDANAMTIGYDFTGGSANAQSWLNWFEIKFQKSLRQQRDSFFAFRNPLVVAPNQICAFRLASTNAGLKVWDVTSNGMYAKLKTEFSANTHRFIDDASIIREYVSFDPKLAKEPELIGNVANQNLHSEGFYDMIIISDAKMIQEARRLAQFRQVTSSLRVLVTSPDQIYNEFSSGSPDPSAIRNFIKMFYDRAGANLTNRPKYLLLFGGTSYRFKETELDRKNLIPSFQSLSSLDPLTSYVSDDFFGYLDDDDDINQNIPAPLLDIAVGRIPARTISQAKTAVDKIINYQTKSDFGTWRNEVTLVADDEDFDLHFNDAEAHAAVIEQQAEWNLNKIYLDAFVQSSGAGGARYPEVNASVNKGMNKGTLIWNYSGHGGNTRLAQEAILEKEMFSEWQNQNRLPLFVTATCDFAPFDNPAQFSIGEDLLMGRTNGAIGLMTTTRLVFASSNKLINNNFLKSLLRKQSNGRYPTIGDAWLTSKNNTVTSSGDYINARKFALLGDPSMKLLTPEYQVKTARISNAQSGAVVDTIKALNKYSLEGIVTTPAATLANDFNGNVYVSIYDQTTKYRTLANDPQSSVKEFKVYDNLIYFGKASVQSGKFSVSFVVPNDIRLSFGTARISYYAEDGNKDAQGVDESIVAGGFGGQVPNDNAGPAINLFLNNEQFVSGSTVKESSLLIVKLADQSGIYLGRYGIGHNIQMVIDGDYANAQVLNDYFEPQLDQNKAGEIRIQLPSLSEGSHKIELKAWDVFNNSSTANINFIVAAQKEIEIEVFQNFPNPFSNTTIFNILMNGPTAEANVYLDIYSIQGKKVKQLNQTINQTRLRSMQIRWDGLDEGGQKLSPGVYLARISFKTKSGVISSRTIKLLLL